jgi:2,3-bisphosphoglycerate-independent phosphoglycerate mutase
MKKIILIIIDGLGDSPIAQLGDKTPLEAAEKPNLDWLVRHGTCGLILPYLFGKEPTSEGGHIALFGYKDYFLGRGPYEAAGLGIKMKK